MPRQQEKRRRERVSTTTKSRQGKVRAVSSLATRLWRSPDVSIAAETAGQAYPNLTRGLVAFVAEHDGEGGNLSSN
ncbi:hypothetical protein NL676_037722 [Syzygium grande]|nr:hypothetical protein NL676_037722 [Syzygium grande]